MAVLGGAALVAAMLFVSPAQAAMSCQSIPGQTIGTDVKVGPVMQRVPAIANIKLCYGTGSVPVASVTYSGGTCTSNCLTVTVGGGDLDLEGATLSWTEDGALKTQALNPAPVDGVDGMCVLSVGMPDAPNPNCFIAIGPDDPTGLTGPILATVNETVNDAVDLTLALAQTGYTITCASIPDRSGYDFCSDPNGWTSVTTDYYYNYTCNRVPEMYDPYYGYSYDFCSDPIGWTNAVVNTARDAVDNLQVCSRIEPAYNPNTGSYYYFCDDPAGWTTASLVTWCGDICDGSTIDTLMYRVRRILADLTRDIALS